MKERSLDDARDDMGCSACVTTRFGALSLHLALAIARRITL